MGLPDWLMLAGITAFAGLAQGAAGFGFAILAVPFYLLILNSVTAVQVVIALTPVISVAVVPRIWRHVEPGLLLRLALGSALGFPCGIWLYLQASLGALKLGVAVLVVVFALVLLLRTRGGDRDGAAGTAPEGRPGGRRGAADVAVGALSGALASSLGMPGPPVLIHLSARDTEKDATRSTLLALFLFSYLASLGLQAAVVGMAGATWGVAAALVPFAAGGAVLGHRLARRMSQRLFRRTALLLLLGTGVYMLGAHLARL